MNLILCADDRHNRLYEREVKLNDSLESVSNRHLKILVILEIVRRDDGGPLEKDRVRGGEIHIPTTLLPVGGSASNYSRSQLTMTDDDSELSDLADLIVEEFDAYRHPDEFKEVSVVIDNSKPDRSTLIVHVDREDAIELADRIERFLRDQGAQTEREVHSRTDVRVLATTG